MGKCAWEKKYDQNMSQPSVGLLKKATRGHSFQITASLFWTLFPINLCPDCHASLFPVVSSVILAHYICHVLSAFVNAGFICYMFLGYLVFCVLPFALLDYCFWTLF